MPKIHDKEFKKYILEKDIQKKVSQMALELSNDYKDEFPLFIVILNGAFIFAADLLRAIDIEAEVSFLKISSYSGLKSSGVTKELIGLNTDIKDRDVIILEDIVDSGNTISHLIDSFKEKDARSIKICTLLFKKEAFKANFKIDYHGFEIPDKFVVGYGLDYDHKGRLLSDIYILSE